ncbi:MAG: hypothetical protein LBU42_06675 [Prevotellaceae bacterium]|jgi:hypothetical protein|nr:hypothetical protein [Prevotellaceae bacterium]
MARKYDWLPQNHEALFEQASLTALYFTDIPARTRMGFGADTPMGQWFDSDFTPKFEKFAACYRDWQDDSHRTKLKTTALYETEKALKASYRMLYTGLLKKNPLVTNDDLTSMSLPKRTAGKRTPAPVPDGYPEVWADTSMLRQVKLVFFVFEGRHHRAKPDGVHGAEVRWAVFEQSQSADMDIEKLVHSSFCTRSPLTLNFSGWERGKILYFTLRWENTRGKKGPFGPIKSAVIP